MKLSVEKSIRSDKIKILILSYLWRTNEVLFNSKRFSNSVCVDWIVCNVRFNREKSNSLEWSFFRSSFSLGCWPSMNMWSTFLQVQCIFFGPKHVSVILFYCSNCIENWIQMWKTTLMIELKAPHQLMQTEMHSSHPICELERKRERERARRKERERRMAMTRKRNNFIATSI